jgi:hypothetical protein
MMFAPGLRITFSSAMASRGALKELESEAAILEVSDSRETI